MFEQVGDLNVAFAQKRAQVNAQVWDCAFASDPALDGACGDVEIVRQRRLPARPVEGFASSYQKIKVHYCFLKFAKCVQQLPTRSANVVAQFFAVASEPFIQGKCFPIGLGVLFHERVRFFVQFNFSQMQNVAERTLVRSPIQIGHFVQTLTNRFCLFVGENTFARAVINDLVGVIVKMEVFASGDKRLNVAASVFNARDFVGVHFGLRTVAGRPIAVPIGRNIATGSGGFK